MVILNIAGVTIALVCLLIMLRIGISPMTRWSLLSSALISLSGLNEWVGVTGAAIGLIILAIAVAEAAHRKWGKEA